MPCKALNVALVKTALYTCCTMPKGLTCIKTLASGRSMELSPTCVQQTVFTYTIKIKYL